MWARVLSAPKPVWGVMSNKWEDLRKFAVSELEHANTEDGAKAAPQLVKCLSSSEYHLCSRCLQVLQRLAAQAPEIRAQLTALKSDPSVPEDSRKNIPYIIKAIDEARGG